ncbi:zinc ABC transporter substrate-binding protein, partial [Gardnerella vaginalis]
WLSKDARSAMASNICDVFSKILPSKKKIFTKRLNTVKSQEKNLDEYIEKFGKDHKNLKYASTNPILFWLMSDMNIEDSTPKEYATQAAQDDAIDKTNVDKFQKLIEERKFDVIINNSQRN